MDTVASDFDPSKTTLAEDIKPPKKHSWLWVVIAMILLALLGLVGYLVIQNQSLQRDLAESPAIQPTNAPVLQPSITPDPTTTWQTYTDNTYKYSVSYPPTWTIPSYGTTQRVSPNNEKLMFIQANAFMNECMQAESTTTKNVVGQTFTIKHFSGISQGEMCSGSQFSDFKEIWFMSPKQDYGIVFQYPKATATTSEQLFDQILSTFKFTGTTLTQESLQTYKYSFTESSDMTGNLTYYLQLNHPSSWVVKATNIRKGADVRGSDCVDFILTEPKTSTSLTIKTTCGAYIGKPIDLSSFKPVEIGRINQGMGGMEYARTVRYYDPNKEIVSYRDILTSTQTESIVGKSAVDSVAVFPDSTFGASDFGTFTDIELNPADGSNPQTNTIATADQIVKSLVLTK